MKEKTLVWIGILFVIFLFLFILFEYFTVGGIWIKNIERWSPVAGTEKVTGDFKPYLKFGNKGKRRTIIPMILRTFTLNPTNTISVKKAKGGLGYERFAYVRFTKFEGHYHSGHVQKFILDDSYIRGRKYEVFNGGSADSLFWFKLDRIERCTVIIEGYSKLKSSNNEESFSYTKDWYIRKKRFIDTGHWN